jgi:4-diphosphocytidyl-2-C-methyl-D-erythritol kinase
VVSEQAFAKVNLVLQVAPPRTDGLHPVCSLIASVDLADDVRVWPAESDSVECPGVSGPNLATAAVVAYRRRVPSLPPVAVRIVKRIPVAAGLAGGSADAAAVLRAINRIAGDPLDAPALRDVAARLGSDVPSQVEPAHAIVQGVGEIVEPIDLPPVGLILVPQREGLATAAVYAQLDRVEGWRTQLDPRRVRAVVQTLAAADRRAPLELHNDLQAATLSLRPELTSVLDQLTGAGAVASLVTGSGPTCFALFPDRAGAAAAASTVPGAIVTQLRRT